MVSIAKNPTIEATNQLVGQTEKNNDLSSSDNKVTSALINIVTKIADNKVMIIKENNLRGISLKFPK
jgi:hypothetical protein